MMTQDANDTPHLAKGTGGETHRMTIRVAKGSLSFAIVDRQSGKQLAFEPYIAKSGVSMAANLREAFKTSPLLQRQTTRARVLVDSPTLVVPIEEYKEEYREALYMHSFPDTEGSIVVSNVMAGLNCVALFALNRDLKLVVEDHYQDVHYTCLMRPVWDYLHRRSFIGNRRKLYAYFHDGVLELFSYERNRFVFCNRYDTRHTKDAVYFILFVWKHLALDQMRDELFIVGDIPDKENLLATLRKYVSVVIVVNPSANFNRAPLTQIEGITFDLITTFLG